MLGHIMVGTNDMAASKAFYDATMAVLGVEPGRSSDERRTAWTVGPMLFLVSKPLNEEPATYANGGTIGLVANSPEQVDAWHAAGVAAGGTSCESPPGWRSMIYGDMYLGYLRDPVGNKLGMMYRKP